MNDLLKNINRIHTTKLGIERIKKNLKLEIEDAVTYCKNIIINKDCIINKKGKNYYCKFKNTTITINSYSYTIITAHKGE